MASRDVEIRLIAKDKTSEVFRKISDSADRMGRDVEDAGRKSARSMEQAKTAGRDLAIGIGALAGAFTLAARSQVNAERQSALLTRQYSDQADSLRELSEEIQRTTQFSNDQAVQAINTFATLQRNYGLTAEQIEQLTRVTVDLAAATGFELNDAAMRVQAAIRGEAEAAEALGLTMNQQAIDRENLTLTMSNQEAAQFRLNALLDQTAFAEGAAAERAETMAGKTQMVANTIQDYAQRLANATGVTGEAIAVASDFTVQIALMGVGIGKLALGIRGLAGAAGIAGLVPLLGGPVGIGIAGAAIAAGAAFLLLRDDASAFEQGVVAAAEASETLRESIDRLAAAGDSFALRADAVGIQLETISAATIQAAGTALPALRTELQTLTDQYNVWELNIAGAGRELEANGFVADEARARIAELTEQISEAERAGREWAEAEIALADIFDHAGPGRALAIANVLALIDGYNAQTDAQKATAFTAVELAQAIEDTAGNLGEYDRHVIEATESTIALGQSAQGAWSHFRPFSTGTLELSQRLEEYAEGGERAAEATHEISTAADRAGGSFLTNLLPAVRATARELAALKAPRLETEQVTGAFTILPAFEFAEGVEQITFLSEMERAYANVGRGVLTANEALLVFKGTQDGLLASQEPYNQQLGEYNNQLSAIEAGLALVQEKQAAGIALSAEEQAILDGSSAAIDRLTGGVEDATTARALLAIQYAENMRVGDQLNANMKGQQEITGQLVEIVKNLILALDGVPEDVKSEIRLIGVESAEERLARLRQQLADFDGSFASATVTLQQIALGPSLLGGGLGAQFLGTGGTIHEGRGAAGGITVGEFGPEFIPNPPRGMQVMPHGASMSRLESEGRRGRGRGGVTNIFRAPVTMVQSPEPFDSRYRAARIAEGR